MAIVATLFFVAVLGLGLCLIAGELASNSTGILRALQIGGTIQDQSARPSARVTRVRHAIRPRSAVAPAQWRAAA